MSGVSGVYSKFNQYQGGATNMYDQVVDVKARVGDEIVEFKQLPANQVIANFGQDGVIVSESKDAIVNEIANIKSSSEYQLERMNYHKNVVDSCEALLRELNPQIAKEYEYDTKISQLETKVDGIENNITDIKTMLKEALNK